MEEKREMKQRIFSTLVAGMLIFSFAGLIPAQNIDEKTAETLKYAEEKLIELLGTDTNWKPTVFKNLKRGMPCGEVKEFFPGLACQDFKKYSFPRVPGRLSDWIKEYQFTLKYGKLDSAAIIFNARLMNAEQFEISLLNVAQRKWGELPPDKLNQKYKYWYNSDRDSVSLSRYNGNWQLKISLPRRDTGEVTAGALGAQQIEAELAKLLGSAERWEVPAMTKFKSGMTCDQVRKVYRTMKGCDPLKNYSRGSVTIKNHPLIHALNFTFNKGQLKNATLVFHRQLDKELFKRISLPLIEKKWGKVKPEKRNEDLIYIYKYKVGYARRSYMRDHWEISHDFPK
jgi:hypothetical protein